MDNLQKVKKKAALDSLLKTYDKVQKSRGAASLEESFRAFAQEASNADPQSPFLETLKELTSQPSVEEMIKRFRKLAGIAK